MSTDVRIFEYPSHRRKKSPSCEIETVVIDDSTVDQTNSNKHDEIVQVLSDDDDEVQICTPTNNELFEEILRKKGLFADVIEKCLELSNQDGMERIVKKTLLGHYQMADESYIKSSRFSKDLLNTLVNLERYPQRKFTHIRQLCDLFRSSGHRKRVKLITLETNLKAKRKKGIKVVKNNNKSVDVIEIDDVETADLEVINLDEYQSEREKENTEITNSQEPTQDTLLTPQMVVPYTHPPNGSSISSNMISKLEDDIKKLHEQIKMLEEKEVVNDSEFGSPYVMCEKLKHTLVESYKELCRLTGSADRIPKRIRLKETKGHPPGPTKLLEKIINNRRDGEVFNFPDMMDVIKCVEEGLKLDGLEWTRPQIMKEASSLFVQCGRALQKSRQRREWKHLQYHVKEEQTFNDDDPATRDPELMAKLELNRMIANHKESELINKYVELQDMPPAARQSILLNYPLLEPEEKDYDENQCNVHTGIDSNEPNLVSETIIPMVDTPNIPKINTEVNAAFVNSFSTNNDTLITEDMNQYTETHYHNIEDSIKIEEDFTNDNITETILQNIIETSNKENCNFQEDRNPQILEKDATTDRENTQTITESDANGNCVSINEVAEEDGQVKIKIEPTEELANLLDSLGDNYTVSIVDVEDPFLIIEISDSDSDDESDPSS